MVAEGVKKGFGDPRTPFQAVIWDERGDQSSDKNTNKLLYCSLREDVWVWWGVCCCKSLGTKTRRVCTVRLVATSCASPSSFGGEVLLRGWAEHTLLQV